MSHLVDLHVCWLLIDAWPLWRGRIAAQHVQQLVAAVLRLEHLRAVLQQRYKQQTSAHTYHLDVTLLYTPHRQ